MPVVVGARLPPLLIDDGICDMPPIDEPPVFGMLDDLPVCATALVVGSANATVRSETPRNARIAKSPKAGRPSVLYRLRLGKPIVHEGDSPIFATRKSGQSPGGRDSDKLP